MEAPSARRGEGRALPLLLSAAVLTLVVAALAWRALHDAQLRGMAEGASPLLVDFREQIYGPERSFLEGANPYRGYPAPNSLAGYAPHGLLVHLPFGTLAYGPAGALYWLFTLGMTIVLARAAVRFGCPAAGWAPTLAVVVGLLVSRPGEANLMNGNVTAHVGAGMYLALQHARRRPLLSAMGLALALIKPSVGLPLATLMLVGRGDVRAVLIGCTLAAVCSAVVIGWILPGAGGIAGLVGSLQAGLEAIHHSKTGNPVTTWMRIDVGALAAKLLGQRLPVPVELGLGTVIVAAGATAIRRFVGNEGRADAPAVISLLILTILIFAYQQVYNSLFLAWPVIAIASRTPTDPLTAWRGGRGFILGLMLFPFVNYGSTWSVLHRFALSPASQALLTSLNPLALATAWLLVLWTLLRERPA